MTRDDFEYCVSRFKWEQQQGKASDEVLLENFAKRLLASLANQAGSSEIFRLEERK